VTCFSSYYEAPPGVQYPPSGIPCVVLFLWCGCDLFLCLLLSPPPLRYSSHLGRCRPPVFTTLTPSPSGILCIQDEEGRAAAAATTIQLQELKRELAEALRTAEQATERAELAEAEGGGGQDTRGGVEGGGGRGRQSDAEQETALWAQCQVKTRCLYIHVCKI